MKSLVHLAGGAWSRMKLVLVVRLMFDILVIRVQIPGVIHVVQSVTIAVLSHVSSLITDLFFLLPSCPSALPYS